jgi:hypothetical protein
MVLDLSPEENATSCTEFTVLYGQLLTKRRLWLIIRSIALSKPEKLGREVLSELLLWCAHPPEASERLTEGVGAAVTDEKTIREAVHPPLG